MTPEEAFMLAIVESPDDDGLRLIYADWLDDHGQADRSEFIRAQVELARLPNDLRMGVRRRELEARQGHLLRERGQEWARPFRGLVAGLNFWRGFVEAVSARPDVFLEHADAWFQAAPLRQVRFQAAMLQLAQPHVVHPSSVPLLRRLAASPHLARLSALDFTRSYLGDDGVEILAASPRLGRLDSLGLSSNEVGNRGVAALASSPNLSGLTHLELGANHVGQDGGRVLAFSQHVQRLVCLDFCGSPIGDQGVEALAASPNLRRLERLGLARSGMGSGGARALAASPHLSRLKWLDVRDNAIGNKARQAVRRRFGKGKCRFS